MGDANYAGELDIAVRAVHMACALCQIVQEGLVSHGTGQVKSKDDDSLVTVAGTLLLLASFSLSLCVGFAYEQNPSSRMNTDNELVKYKTNEDLHCSFSRPGYLISVKCLTLIMETIRVIAKQYQ